MGYISPYASTTTKASGTGGYVSPYANGALTPQAPRGHSVLGFLGNLLEGAKDLTLGMGKLIVAPAADIAGGLADLIPGVNYHYMTPQILAGLKSIPQDYWDRYSPLLPGGRPASQVLQELYDKPLSFAMDATALASLAGKGAEFAGEAANAAKGGEALATQEGMLGALERGVASENGMGIGVSDISSRTAKAAAVRQGLEVGGNAPWYAKLLPDTTFVREGEGFVQTTEMKNPLLRATRNLVENKFGKETLSEFQSKIPERANAFVDNTGPREINAYIRREEELLGEARMRGMDRISKPSIYNFRNTSTARALRNFESSSWFRDRLKDSKALTTIIKPALDTMSSVEKGISNLRSMALNVFINGFADGSEGLAKRVAEESGQYLQHLDLTSAPVALRDTLDAAAVTKVTELHPDYQPEAAIAQLDKFINETLQGKDIPGMGWDVAHETDVANRVKDMIVRDTEGIANGTYDAQRVMDARLAVKDILDHSKEFDIMKETPALMLNRAYRPMMEAMGIGLHDWDAVPNLSLAEAKQAQQLLMDHISKVSSVRRKATRSVESGRVATKEERRAALAEGMGLEPTPAKLSAKQISYLEKRKALLEGKLVEHEASLEAPVPGELPPSNKARTKIQQQLDTVNAKLKAGRKGLVKKKVRSTDEAIAEQVRMHPSGGMLPEFLQPGGVPGQNFLVSSLAEEVRAALGDGLGNKILQGVTDVGSLRERLERLGQDASSLADRPFLELDDALRAAQDAGQAVRPPGYFPMVDINKTKRMDWLPQTPGTTTAVRAAKDPHLKYNEQILLREGRYEKDALKARLTRAARHNRADATVRYIEDLTHSSLGRKIMPGETIAPDERIIATSYTRGANRISKMFYDARLKHMESGLNEAEATMRATDEVVRAVQDGVSAGTLDAAKMEMYAVPLTVADQLNAAARAAGILNGPVAKIYFQGPMNVWRSMVLAGSPRWIVNNILGNAVFNIMQGAPVSRAFHILEGRYANILKDRYGWDLNWVPGARSGKTLVAAIEERFDKAVFDRSSIQQEAETGYNKIESNEPTYIPNAETVPGPGPKMLLHSRNAPGPVLKRLQSAGDAVRAFNSEVETAFRMNSALTSAERLAGIGHMKRLAGRFSSTQDRMSKIFANGISEGAARSIVKDMNYFLGDFADLGPWERNILRPYVFPFWGFYKHVGKLLLSYPFEYPERAVVLNGLAHVTKDMTDAYGPMPSWLEGAVPLAPPGQAGETPFLMTAGPNPFSGLFESPLAGLSPLIKIPVEHFTGRSLFTGKPFSDKDTVTPYGSETPFHIVRDANGNPVDVYPVGKVTPSLFETIVSQVPQYDMVKDLIAGGKTFDTSGLLDAIRARLGDRAGVLTDPGTGGAKYPVGLPDTLARLLGYNEIPYDLNAFQQNLQTQAQAALTEAKRTR